VVEAYPCREEAFLLREVYLRGEAFLLRRCILVVKRPVLVAVVEDFDVL
jgi:hypothetical protein